MHYWLILVLSVCPVALFACDGQTAPSGAVPSPVLALEVAVETPEVSVGDWAHFSVHLVNAGDAATTVLLPGDGSDVGWRTPVARWNPPQKQGGRCGNMNPLTPEDFVTLAPGERVPLEWVRYYHFTEPGIHSVTLELEHIPDMPWGGLIGKGTRNEPRMQRLRQLPAYKVVSNSVEVTVFEAPAAVD